MGAHLFLSTLQSAPALCETQLDRLRGIIHEQTRVEVAWSLDTQTAARHRRLRTRTGH
jgi:hypothetical protein